MKHWIRCGMCSVIALMATAAFAQQNDPATEKEAQALLEQADTLMTAQKFPEACRKLEVVLQKLPQATGARLKLANCYKGEGRLASALHQFEEVEKLARIAGRKDRIAEASKNATELARIVAKLQLDVPREVASIPGITITLDGQVQNSSTWGMRVPVDAMEHEVTATAPGREPWRTSIPIIDSKNNKLETPPVVVKVGIPPLSQPTLTIEIPLNVANIPGITVTVDGIVVDAPEWADGSIIEAGTHEVEISAPGYKRWSKRVVLQNGDSVHLKLTPPEKIPLKAPPPAQTAIKVVPTPPAAKFDLQTAGIVTTAAGGLALGLGAVFGAVAISKNRENIDNGLCTEDGACYDDAIELQDAAYALANASTGTIIAGGVLIAGGLTMIALSPKHRKAARGPTPGTSFRLGPTGFGIQYQW